MRVDLIDHMGNDLTVVNAARVSMDKISKFICKDNGPSLTKEDSKLITYLAKHNHWTPFGHPQVTFRIKAPIFVARQLGKHQVGMVWNEVSRRYVDSEPEFFAPEGHTGDDGYRYHGWRKAADNVKQGSTDEVADLIPLSQNVVSNYAHEAIVAYTSLLKSGVCPEQARMVLPQSMYTEWYWTGSLAAWSRVCKLRLDPHTQRETQDIAKRVSVCMSDLFPVSWEALNA